MVRNPSVNAGDAGVIPGLGRFPGEGKSNPLQENPLHGKPHGQRSLGVTVHGVKRVRHNLSTKQRVPNMCQIWLC